MKMVVKNRMMFSYPYFKPPYYRYSRYGYYYPNAFYAHKINTPNMQAQPNRKPYEDTIHRTKVEKSKIKQDYVSNTGIKGHSGVSPTMHSHKRCHYNGLFLYTKKRRILF